MWTVPNVVFDLETLDTAPTAAILALAAVSVDTGAWFYRNIDLDSCLRAGLTVNGPTFYWWMRQEFTAREALLAQRVDLRSAIVDFGVWCDAQAPDTEYWSHATFDPPILCHATRALGLSPQFIPFRQFRDLRTLTALSGPVDLVFEGVPHNALDDARHEAKRIRRLLYE